MLFALVVMALATVIATLALLLYIRLGDLHEADKIIVGLHDETARQAAVIREWERDMEGTLKSFADVELERDLWRSNSLDLCLQIEDHLSTISNLETSVETLHLELVKRELAGSKRSGNPAKKAAATQAKSVWS